MLILQLQHEENPPLGFPTSLPDVSHCHLAPIMKTPGRTPLAFRNPTSAQRRPNRESEMETFQSEAYERHCITRTVPNTKRRTRLRITSRSGRPKTSTEQATWSQRVSDVLLRRLHRSKVLATMKRDSNSIGMRCLHPTLGSVPPRTGGFGRNNYDLQQKTFFIYSPQGRAYGRNQQTIDT